MGFGMKRWLGSGWVPKAFRIQPPNHPTLTNLVNNPQRLIPTNAVLPSREIRTMAEPLRKQGASALQYRTHVSTVLVVPFGQGTSSILCRDLWSWTLAAHGRTIDGWLPMRRGAVFR